VVVAGLAAGRPRSTGGSSSGAAACEAATAHSWDGAWSPARQEELGATLLARGGSVGQKQWPVLRRRLDEPIAEWRAAAGSLCALPAGRGQDCAAQARGAIQDIEQLVLDDPAELLARAPAAVDAVPVPEACGASPAAPAWPTLATKAEVRRRLGLLAEADKL